MAEDRYVVYENRRQRHPHFRVRVVDDDGHAFSVIRHGIVTDGIDRPRLPLTDAIREALRRARLTT